MTLLLLSCYLRRPSSGTWVTPYQKYCAVIQWRNQEHTFLFSLPMDSEDNAAIEAMRRFRQQHKQVKPLIDESLKLAA